MIAMSKETAVKLEHVRTDHTRPNWEKTHSAAHGRVSRSKNAVECVNAMLSTKEWKGSEVCADKDSCGRDVMVLKHPSGARCTVFA